MKRLLPLPMLPILAFEDYATVDRTHDREHPRFKHEHEHLVEGATPELYVIMRVRSPQLSINDPNKVKLTTLMRSIDFLRGVPLWRFC